MPAANRVLITQYSGAIGIVWGLIGGFKVAVVNLEEQDPF